jgi:hypothetical protein
MNYMETAKEAEFGPSLKSMYMGAVTYFKDSSNHYSGNVKQDPTFPADVGPTPGVSACTLTGQVHNPETTDWGAIPEWKALKFKMEDNHRFQYQFINKGTAGVGAAFYAVALADLGCDGNTRYHYRHGIATTNTEVKGTEVQSGDAVPTF